MLDLRVEAEEEPSILLSSTSSHVCMWRAMVRFFVWAPGITVVDRVLRDDRLSVVLPKLKSNFFLTTFFLLWSESPITSLSPLIFVTLSFSPSSVFHFPFHCLFIEQNICPLCLHCFCIQPQLFKNNTFKKEHLIFCTITIGSVCCLVI